MIPRVRPSYSLAELRAALRAAPDTVVAFERELGAYFGMRHALVFPYGRSAIYHGLRALGRTGEVVQPAYNCAVVAHAAMLAGCRPVFVDAQAESPNQDVGQMIDSVTADTVAVVPTSIFGTSFDAAALTEAVRRRNRDALVLIDCAQCFDAGWRGASLASQGDAAILAFGVGKPMTTLYGGALLTDRDDLASAVRRLRDGSFASRGGRGTAMRWAYYLATWAAFSGPVMPLTDVLESRDTPLRRYLKRFRGQDEVALPNDNTTAMLPMEAAVGRAQLARVAGFIARRRAIAATYARELVRVPGLRLLDWPEGSSFAIYAARLTDPATRERVLQQMRRGGVQGDTTLAYVVPDLDCYRARDSGGRRFPHAAAWAASVINLPNHPTMTDRQAQRVVRVVREVFAGMAQRSLPRPAAA